MATDKQRMDWLCAHVTYVEHLNKDRRPAAEAGKGEGQYWPQGEDDWGGGQIEDECGLMLQDYIDAQLEKEALSCTH